MPDLIESEFPQFYILNSRRFERFLEARDIWVTVEDLEHFEKIGFLYPILRLHRPKVSDNSGRKYAGISENPYELKEYLKQGFIEYPTPENFRPWKEYRDDTNIRHLSITIRTKSLKLRDS